MLTLWDLIEPIAKRLRPKIAPPSAPPPVSASAETSSERTERPVLSCPRRLRSASIAAGARSRPVPKPDTMLARYDRMVEVMEPLFVNSVRSAYPDDQAQRLGHLFVEELNAEIPSMIEDAAAAYAHALSEEDLVAMREFYRSPAGQHMVQSLPAVSAALQSAGAAAGQAAGQRAAQRLHDELQPNSGRRT